MKIVDLSEKVFSMFAYKFIILIFVIIFLLNVFYIIIMFKE